MNGFVGVCCHLLECARRGPDVGVDAEAMFVAVVVVCTAALNQLDAAAQVDDALGLLELREQRVLEVDESHAENLSCAVHAGELARRGFEGFGARSGGNKHLDVEIRADDAADDSAQRQNRDDHRAVVRPGCFAARGQQQGSDE